MIALYLAIVSQNMNQNFNIHICPYYICIHLGNYIIKICIIGRSVWCAHVTSAAFKTHFYNLIFH